MNKEFLRVWRPLATFAIASLAALTTNVIAGDRSLTLEYDSPVLVSQGGVEILDAEVDAYLSARVPANDIPAVLASHERIARILESLIRRQAFYELARSEGLLDSSENIARLYISMIDQAASIYRDHFRREVELDSYETLARELFLTNPDRFRGSETIDLEQILITVHSDRGEVEAMHEVLRLHELLTDGASFESLAKSYSDDPTVEENSGVLTGVKREELVGPVRGVLDQTEAGVWADPVRSQFGWHIVRIRRTHAAEPLDWEEARPLAEAQARQEHLALALERHLRDLQDAPAQFSEGAIERLLSRHDAQPERGVVLEPELSILE